jgi:alkylhydroperoxidase/carboxymuconolactone decarboxylase family protein YurZ
MTAVIFKHCEYQKVDKRPVLDYETGVNKMDEHPLKIIQDKDNDFFNIIEASLENALSEGSIPLKYKFLIAMALDAEHGAVDGVKVLALQAMEAGATKEEIMEAVRIANYIGGIGSVYTAANALRDIL